MDPEIKRIILKGVAIFFLISGLLIVLSSLVLISHPTVPDTTFDIRGLGIDGLVISTLLIIFGFIFLFKKKWIEGSALPNFFA